MKRISAVVMASLVASGLLIAQQQLTGKWQGLTPNREPVVLDLLAKGGDVNGTMTVGDQKASIENGKISKNRFTFRVAMGGGAEDCSDDPVRFACDVSGGAAQLVDALAKIREVVTTVVTHTMTVTTVEDMPLECEWVIPEPPDGQRFDRDLVNVQLSAPSLAAPVALGKVDDASGCAERGWHYDDPNNPTRIQLCEASCRSATNARMEVQFGCETVIAPR